MRQAADWPADVVDTARIHGDLAEACMHLGATVRTTAGRTTSVNISVYTKPKPQFKKGPNPEPDRKDGKMSHVIDLSAFELVALWATGGPTDVTLPPDGKFVRQLRTEDHYRSFLGKMRNLVKGGTYTAEGSFDKSNSTRSGGEKAWEMLTDVNGLLTEGIWGQPCQLRARLV